MTSDKRWGERLQRAPSEAGELHDRAMLLGYNVGSTNDGALGQEPGASFWVRRVDQPSDTRVLGFAGVISIQLAVLAVRQ